MSKTIRIKDIAQLAGVSVGTVDRVIHERGQVSKESYDKVMEILEKTGYKPNLIARTLGSNKTYKISALLPNPLQDEYWKFSNDGVEEALEEWEQYGVQIEIFHFDLYDKKTFLLKGNEALSTIPDGLLMAPIFNEESKVISNLCESQEIPYVVFNNNIEGKNPIGFIGQDLHQSGRLAAQLLHANYKEGSFATLHVYDDIESSTHLHKKEKGFQEYFSEQSGNFNLLSVDLNQAEDSTIEQKILSLIAEEDLKGIFITTSKGASKVSSVLAQQGKNDISIVAYDLLKENILYLKKGIIDFLINQNSKHQAFIGVNQLVNHLLFKKKIKKEYLFPLEVITKENLDSFLESDKF